MELNARGIPKAPFVDEVENFLENNDAEALLKKFNETLWTYKRMETSIQNRRKNLQFKLPELEKSLQVVVQLLENKRDNAECVKVKYEIADNLFTNAKITQFEKCGIWLGANVMLEYTLEEAEILLSDKVKVAQESLNVTEEDCLFLREQITTMEVNIARTYNWDVKRRKLQKAQEQVEAQ